jgi:NAD(P)-dependent dehydrogenase (short-subunit alcohol dehydrogenase family)
LTRRSSLPNSDRTRATSLRFASSEETSATQPSAVPPAAPTPPAVARAPASSRSTTTTVARVRSEFGRLDRLVNNAGIRSRDHVGTAAEGDWRRVMDVNLWSVASLTQAAAEEIWRGQSGAAVVNMSSRVWVSGGALAYTASKAGVVGLTRALAVELAPYDVRVNAVAPSTVLTPMVREGLTEEQYADHVARARRLSLLPRLATPEDVANAVAFLSSSEAGYVTGEVLHVCGGSQLASVAASN